MSELKDHKEAEQAEARHQAHHGQGPHIGRVADVQVFSPQEQRPSNDCLKLTTLIMKNYKIISFTIYCMFIKKLFR